MSLQPDRLGAVTTHPRSPSRRTEEYEDLFAQAPVIFVALGGPSHLLEAANPAFFEAFGGGRTQSGAPIGEVIPELGPQGVLDRLDAVYRTGTTFRARGARLVLGAPGKEREGFFDFTYEPRRDAVGEVDGVIVIAVETTVHHHAQLLASEQRLLLEQIAREAPLGSILTGMARAIEELSPDLIVSVLLADRDGRQLRHGTGPSLPAFYNEAIDGIAIGADVGSCGTAAYLRVPVTVTDIATDHRWKGYRELAERAGLAACWSTPILGTDDRLLGTFAMYHRAPKAPEETDLALSAAFARIAALAIERHHALEAERAAQEREREAREDLAFVLDASTAITREPHYADCLQRLARLTVPTLAPLCSVHVLEDGRTRRIAVAAATPAEEDLLASPVLTGQVDRAVARVLASGATETSRPAASPGDPPGPPGVTGYVSVPLATRGRTFGVLTLLATDRPLDGHAVALAEELARRAASSADNAHQFSDRVQLARDLQAGLLPPELPRIPGADLAAYYHPAGEGPEVGGDFYDVFPLPDDRWAFMIGDVCGRGALAATTTGMVRHTARAAARLLHDPADVVAAINDALTGSPLDEDHFVSLVYGELRHTPSHLALELIRAGHVPPLVRRTDGTVEHVVQSGLLLGISPEFHGACCRLDLAPGDSLVLVTDGITEARSATGEFFDEHRLADALLALPGTASGAAGLIEAVHAAVTAFAGRSTPDDQAALVLTAT
ncbi:MULTISPECIES: GAF domain-containing SpoIIE family protein phosphatase [unclassified Streptomyces]|uniref:GAF domain-containing SpoIIE family protein phosphatase n=1 Tax=unclassified Streptomyces TaxID=2593676 RepID=UPI000882D609|nr:MULTISPECIES: SpoIIE family protein phosphatase [unclassified Streptomyces]PBC80696.1 serine phosphatase RsbU (regulator of sigma subunit) [Streptomyces sp. 2321.6]SDR57615.1 Serine phosphatase RsbU, regulator of sigma subunit [Streptomyces sp. KS_16]SEB84965.1 Serine phosphatase RsbU, regulator of sigma subunit [Streptomyces sp. 2133.1]SNC61700.1 Serine phosphatase RsbU, regulator of sigma subunit [Streptomyces sp. 2114.4]